MSEVKVNFHGVNAKIKAHILPEDEMRRIGLHGKYYEGTDHEEDCPYWYFSRAIQFPKEKQYRNLDFDFDVHIPKDGSDIRIDLLDMDFCQPYDYQRILSNNPKHPIAMIVNEQVEKFMKYLQDKGVLSGHEYGEYI